MLQAPADENAEELHYALATKQAAAVVAGQRAECSGDSGSGGGNRLGGICGWRTGQQPPQTAIAAAGRLHRGTRQRSCGTATSSKRARHPSRSATGCGAHPGAGFSSGISLERRGAGLAGGICASSTHRQPEEAYEGPSCQLQWPQQKAMGRAQAYTIPGDGSSGGLGHSGHSSSGQEKEECTTSKQTGAPRGTTEVGSIRPATSTTNGDAAPH